MRAAALGGVWVLLASNVAGADRFEASGFIGLGVFTANTELGNSWAAEQVPNSAPVFGARIGWIAIPGIADRGFWDKVEVVAEAELSIATAFTGGFTGESGRMSYFAPVFGWRGHAMLRFAQLRSFAPHLVLGAGGETVASSSPFMSKETDPVVYYGAGATFAINDQWRVRIDVRHGIMPGRNNDLTSTLEAQFGVQARFGLPTKRVHVAPPVEKTEVVAKVADDDVDTDGDGITDRLDLCPREPETVNGVDDGDGCPEKDPDGDGILENDKCPNEPEDFDGFEDDDGCPDPDNDGDGIPDVKDTCPNQPETKNGVDDADGCPDTVPDNIVKALAVGKTLRFEYNRARVTPLAATTLKPLHLMLLAHPDVSITIAGVPEKTGNGDLARRRAEAVKWYLVDQGITESRIEVGIAIATAKPGGPVIELSLRTK